MFSPSVRLLLLLVLVMAQVGCSFRRRQAPTEPLGPIRLGKVALVNDADRFVLIETTGSGTPAAGQLLRIYAGDAVVAELRATGVKRRPFLVADVVSGTVSRGDTVIQSRSEDAKPPRAEAATPQPVTATPAGEPARRPLWKRWLLPFGK